MNRDSKFTYEGNQATQLQAHQSKPVWVQGNGYRCLAVFDDKNGGWKTYYTGKRIPDFIEVLSGASN